MLSKMAVFHLSLWPSSIPSYIHIYHIFFIHSSIKGHLVCFHVCQKGTHFKTEFVTQPLTLTWDGGCKHFENNLESLQIKPGKRSEKKRFSEPVTIWFHFLSNNKYYFTFKDA